MRLVSSLPAFPLSLLPSTLAFSLIWPDIGQISVSSTETSEPHGSSLLNSGRLRGRSLSLGVRRRQPSPVKRTALSDPHGKPDCFVDQAEIGGTLPADNSPLVSLAPDDLTPLSPLFRSR